jgi:hypothetical protein
MKTLITSLLLVSSIYAVPLDLMWNDNSDNENGFIIERRIGADTEPFVQIGNVAANVKEFVDPDAPVSQTVTYRVYAFNDYGNSGYTNEAQVLTFTPTKPDGLKFKRSNPLSRLTKRLRSRNR